MSDDSSGESGSDIFDVAAAGLVVAGLWTVGRSISSFGDARSERKRRAEAARLVEVARSSNKSGRTKEAVAAYSSALANDPQNGEAANALAWIFAANATEESHLAHAMVLVNQALQCPADDPTRANYLDTRGEVHLRRQDYIRAIADFESCLALLKRPDDHPGPSTLFRLGLAYVGLNQLHKARDILRIAVQLDPKNVDALVQLAHLSREFSDYEAAIQELTEAYSCFHHHRPENDATDYLESSLLNDLGYTHLLAGREEKAEVIFRAALATCDRNPYPYASLALIAGSSGDIDTMRHYLHAAIGKAGAIGDATFVSSLLLQARGSAHPDVILEALLTAGKLSPEMYRQQRIAFERQTVVQPHTTVNVRTEGGPLSMGDLYSISGGQQGAVGKDATNYGSMQQVSLPPGTDVGRLILELTRLKGELLKQASSSAELHAVAEIESAKKSLEVADEPAVLGHLQKAGRWALDIAAKIGVPVAEAALRSAMGV